MLEIAERRLKILAISNLLISLWGIYIFIRYPFLGFGTFIVWSDVIITITVFLLDFIATARFLMFVKKVYQEVFSRWYHFLILFYLGFTILVRLFITGTSNSVIVIVPGDVIVVFLVSLLYALIMLKIRSLPIGVHVQGRLLSFAVLNILTVVFLLLPVTVDLGLQDFPLGYIIIFAIGGVFKWISYLFGASLYMYWSTNLPSILSIEHHQNLYPGGEENDTTWPNN